MRRVVVVGFGSIGQGLMPLLRKHFASFQVQVLETKMTESRKRICLQYGADWQEVTVQKENYRELLRPMLHNGDLLLNFANSVSSLDLLELAQGAGSFYLDTCIDPWSYGPVAGGIALSNYALREQILAAKKDNRGKPTALVAHGANPGFVSILVKKGLLEMALANGFSLCVPDKPTDWARLARLLDVRVIQVSERDTQRSAIPRAPGEFVSTWSVEGFVTECLQPAELGWGTHERTLPHNGRMHEYGCGAGIYLEQPSFSVKVKSWSPSAGDFEAFMITHNEALSIADYLTLREAGVATYRPTVYYAYRPCDDAVASFALIDRGNAESIKAARILRDEVVSGMDELGVFLISRRYPSLWIGSNLSIAQARALAGHNNATSLQVVSSVAAAIEWMLKHPEEGIVESESLDFDQIYRFAEPYWSPIVCEFINWRPHPLNDDLQFQDFLVDRTVAPFCRHQADPFHARVPY